MYARGVDRGRDRRRRKKEGERGKGVRRKKGVDVPRGEARGRVEPQEIEQINKTGRHIGGILGHIVCSLIKMQYILDIDGAGARKKQ